MCEDKLHLTWVAEDNLPTFHLRRLTVPVSSSPTCGWMEMFSSGSPSFPKSSVSPKGPLLAAHIHKIPSELAK